MDRNDSLNFFSFQESVYGGWIIRPNIEMFRSEQRPIKGSYNLLACRISGLSWPDWLRYCQQNGAVLYGKNSYYILAIWKEKNQGFLDMLNERANQLSKMLDLKELRL